MVLFSRTRAPRWDGFEDPYREAKCRKLPVPRYKADPYFDDEAVALAVCNGGDGILGYENAGEVCPLREQCLIFSLINHEMHGVWGGMLTHDRMHLKRHVPREWWIWHPPTPKPVPEPDEEDCELQAA